MDARCGGTKSRERSAVLRREHSGRWDRGEEQALCEAVEERLFQPGGWAEWMSGECEELRERGLAGAQGDVPGPQLLKDNHLYSK